MLIFPCVLYTFVDVLTGTASGQKTPTGWKPPAECAPGDAGSLLVNN